MGWLTPLSERVIDTACAHVFLAPDRALKLKRHDDLGYVDFSTTAQRLWALERELAFNQPTAPGIYRAVRRITREADGSLTLDGTGGTVDHVLEMQRFDETAVLAACPERVTGDLAEALGRTIASVHWQAPLRPEGGVAAMTFTVASNARLLRDTCEGLDQARVETMISRTETELARQLPLLARRAAAGYSRRCHGDLHLGNILLQDEVPILFDCIEFSDILSDIDVLYDLAFLLMDLAFRGHGDAAVRALSAYLDEAGRNFPSDIWEGAELLPLMLSVRAGVRAHVTAQSNDPVTARAYVEAAIANLSPAPPVLAAVGGLSGSGKSTFSRLIAPLLGASPGAVILRTDEVRKRVLNQAVTAPAGPENYAPDAMARTYDELFANARALLEAGRAVVLDASFIDPVTRARAEGLARELAVPFHPAWLEAPSSVLEARAEGRTGDASDATIAILREQLARDPGPLSWPRVDVSGPAEPAAGTWFRTLV